MKCVVWDRYDPIQEKKELILEGWLSDAMTSENLLEYIDAYRKETRERRHD